MKRIVLMTDPDRLDTQLVERLQWLFPECDLEIVAAWDGRCPETQVDWRAGPNGADRKEI